MNLREVGRPILWLAIGAVVAAVPILLLRHQPDLPREPVTIRTYPVAPEIAGEMKSALADALVNSSWRVSLPAEGLLLVNAPESVQTGVQGILAQVAANKPAPTPAIHFEIWLVSAAPGKPATADNGAGLGEVRPALADIQKTQGPLHFELLEKLALQARAGNEDSQIQGAHATMRITPTVRHDSKDDPVIAARINVQVTATAPPQFPPTVSNPGSLKALVELRPGQLLVIGQSSLTARPIADSTPAQMYYIVRASL
jgi:hypothetical protein